MPCSFSGSKIYFDFRPEPPPQEAVAANEFARLQVRYWHRLAPIWIHSAPARGAILETATMGGPQPLRCELTQAPDRAQEHRILGRPESRCGKKTLNRRQACTTTRTGKLT
jgi:hypothetical protein